MRPLVISPTDHTEHHHVGSERSSCFYYPTWNLSLLPSGNNVVRPGRIEVSDTEAELHQHAGVTIVFIASGSGVFKSTDSGNEKVRAGDMIIIPPMSPHLSVADKGTTMIEWIVYLGEQDDIQKSLPV
jgi:mannose-6-phosphate isomerase-like protein (cupin superfamily)